MIRLALQSLEYYVFLKHVLYNGLVAQWITRLTTDQKIAGSNPAKIDLLLVSTSFSCILFLSCVHCNLFSVSSVHSIGVFHILDYTSILYILL